MTQTVNQNLIIQINENLGIAHKIGKFYFPDATEREDVIQEMMYQLWRSYSSFDGRSKFSTWMYRVCLNTALTYRRRMKNEKTESLSLRHHEIPDPPKDSLEDDIELLLRAIGTLSPLNKAVVLLYLENMSYEEIASITGLTRANVSVKLVRIKQELERILKNTNKSIDHDDTRGVKTKMG